MKLLLRKGETSQTVLVFIQDTSTLSGEGLTGLSYNSSGLECFYYREAAGTGATQITLATATLGTWVSGGFVEVDATNMPGWYEFSLPNAVLASGADFVGVQLRGVSNMAQVNLEIQLTEINVNDAVRAGLTALPNANADAAGGLVISDAGGLDIDSLSTSVGNIETDTNELQADWTNGGRLDLILDELTTQGDTNETKLDTIDSNVDAILVDTGTTLPATLSIIDSVVDSILVDTAEIGVAGAGLTEAGGTGDQLTAIPWNSSWDTEVQSECNEALVAIGLDHFFATAVTGTDITDNSFGARLVSASATADFDDYDNTTDSLQAIADGAGGGGFNSSDRTMLTNVNDVVNNTANLTIVGPPFDGDVLTLVAGKDYSVANSNEITISILATGLDDADKALLTISGDRLSSNPINRLGSTSIDTAANTATFEIPATDLDYEPGGNYEYRVELRHGTEYSEVLTGNHTLLRNVVE